MRSIASRDRVEAEIKDRQHDILQSNPLAITLKSSSLMPSVEHSSCRLRKLSSKQVFDPSVAPNATLKPIIEEQRRDIDRIMANVSRMQQNVESLSKQVELLKSRRHQAPYDYVTGVDIPFESMTNISSRVSELDTLKVGTKVKQQRIKCLEESLSQRWPSPPILESSQTLRRLSPATEKEALSHIDASSNRTLFPVKQIHINGTASTGSRTTITMPSLQTSRKGPERKEKTRTSLNARNLATHPTAPMLITDSANTPILSQHTSPTEGASTGSQQVRREYSDFDDGPVDDISPHTSTGSFTDKYRQPANKTAHPHQTPKSKNAPKPPPNFTVRQSVPIPLLPISEPRSVGKPARGAPAHRDSKRRKTTAFDATFSSTHGGPADHGRQW